jgi:multidrug efflux pump subunit AcrB
MIWNWKADHQNVTLPSGDVKIGSKDYTLATNSSPDAIASINQFPVNEVDGRIVLIYYVAHVRRSTRGTIFY